MPSIESGLKTRQSLIDAAKQFLGEGNTSVSIGQLAKAAGVSVGSLYTYFADKSELFEAAAADAVMSAYPEILAMEAAFEDPGLGFIAGTLFACRRHEFDPITARIIVTVGPFGFAHNTEYLQAPITAIKRSVELGNMRCEDPEAFVVAGSGAYQAVLARIVAGTADASLGERVMWMFAESVGYTREQFQLAVDYVEEYCAQKVKQRAAG